MPLSYFTLKNIKYFIRRSYPDAIIQEQEGRLSVIAGADISFNDAFNIDIAVKNCLVSLPNIDICRFEGEIPVYSRSTLIGSEHGFFKIFD